VGAATRQHADRWGQLGDGDTCFSPVVDGEVLPTTPWRALAGGAGRDVELVVGHNREEFRLFMGMAGKFGTVSEEAATRSLRLFAPGPDGEQAYRAAFPHASAEELYERVRSDWLFRMPSLHLAEAHAAGGGRTYLYELTWAAPGAGGQFGACHGLDIPLLFGTFEADLGPLLIGQDPSGEAHRLSTEFRTAWTTFATTGDPGWPAFDTGTRLTRIFDAEPAVTPYPEEVSRRLWHHHEFAPLPLLG
jgi:para-nitrobenzyl esterase